jgi:hypothetical protein
MSYVGVPMMTAKKAYIRAWHSADLSKDDKLMKLLDTYYKVRLDYNGENYSQMLTWCLENSQSKFRDIRNGDWMDWYFEQEQDALIFAMKWS